MARLKRQNLSEPMSSSFLNVQKRVVVIDDHHHHAFLTKEVNGI
jgi:hypothetical protein